LEESPRTEEIEKSAEDGVVEELVEGEGPMVVANE